MAIATAACDEGTRGAIVANGFASPSTVVNAAVVPSTLPFQILPASGCPFASPFASAFSLVVDHRGPVDLLLHEAGFQFIDAGGLVSPLFFTTTDLTLLFGSTFVSAGTSRTFDFRTQFGCQFRSSPHRLAGRLVLVDRHGERHERTISARIGN
jgi:hypothetical protein